MNRIAKLAALGKKRERLVLGLMSGTSVNAVDVALCRIEGHGLPQHGKPEARVNLLSLYSLPIPAALKARVLNAAALNVREIAELDQDFGELMAKACVQALKRARVSMKKIDLVGCHGQTIYHHSGMPGVRRATLQVGGADYLAEILGVPVISDFRSRDIACGGEGAPLTPYADAVLFARHWARVGIVNIGGISNFTLLDPDSSKIIGFDLGPGNAPLDRLTRLITSNRREFDRNGDLARSGKIDLKLLQKLISADKFLSRPPPKSAGVETYGDAFVDRLLALHEGRPNASLLATATAFTAQAIAGGILHHIPPKRLPDIIYVAGGGALNRFLMEILTGVLEPIVVATSDEFGIPALAREAMSFAVLANDLVCGDVTSMRKVTGAKRSAPLGKISLPV